MLNRLTLKEQQEDEPYKRFKVMVIGMSIKIAIHKSTAMRSLNAIAQILSDILLS